VATIRPRPSTALTRLERALERFQDQQFSRKDYLALFPTISPATASRDLRAAVDRGALTRTGAKATTRYRRA
jgi:Fic family protein